ncbi:hypothetical protein A3742_04455 [Oleiphilus sp. HI0071]|uniref:hypothetical protein n=1 Tax=unclassified Oleiphilus TaxID=2631174 RepID=UPI0007C3D80D|nr:MULTISPECIES: hypothetical protein [unclassified Oleiphilus]KZY66225.1 hypothetical protein A3737_17490 [Oleiphilus sp. HI0065]KZY85242.1 hypothetical protein A3742_29665 [Oleiphilus sp. HI0071]KZY90706.1 hypothetical protein A3744_15390 [Oleiphilus sp. HI0073]KZZ42352.1 hypothetical protein A3758_07285 [Oleiphilus sp. HI0118]KZZ50377.1 hypothetical protein A3760_14110 [Oleiphilus sp. HI0122]KZZ64081.1 hypothetical protein A3765_01055 [Oleiphilus sp. HI0130]KZZ81661.1 hypothetical protein
MLKTLLHAGLFLAFMLSGLAVYASEPSSKKGQTIAIIGNSELPKIDVALPWRVASDKDATKIELTPQKMPDALKPTDISEHRERVYFERYIKVSTESFTN